MLIFCIQIEKFISIFKDAICDMSRLKFSYLNNLICSLINVEIMSCI
jgi:hypothetical protein